MKKQLLLLGAAALFSWNVGTAQDSGVSVGVEIALPLGDFGEVASLGYGASAGYELGLSDNLSVTARAGYILLAVDSELSDFIKNMSMIPIQAGVRYYLDEVGTGLHAGLQIGVHSMSVTTEDIDLGALGTIEGSTESESDLSIAPTVGFSVTEQIDVSGRFNIIMTKDSDIEGSENSNYIGIRASFKF